MKTRPIIFNISGGLGKNIMATAVVRAIKKAYPDSRIVVTSPHRDVWLSNPHVDEIINLETTPLFYRDYIQGKDALIFRHDPYHSADFAYRRKHLTEIWCDLCGVPWDGEKPELYFTAREDESVKKMLGIGDVGAAQKKQKLFFLQTNGGPPGQAFPISWARDLPIPIAEKIVAKMNGRGYRSIHLRRSDQPQVAGTDYIDLSHRQALCAIQFSDARLFIDSFAQHAAAAFGLASAVAWIVNDPAVFGYRIHGAVIPAIPERFRHHIDAYLEKYDITGKLEECPYDDMTEAFDEKEILRMIDDQ